MTAIKTTSEEETIPFYPDHVGTELKVIVGVVVLTLIIGIVGMIAPVGLGEPADPMDTPMHVKPEWYFLALYQLLKYIPKTAGAVLPVIAIALVAIWPFLDHKPDKSKKAQKVRFVLVAAGVIIVIAATIWGEVS